MDWIKQKEVFMRTWKKQEKKLMMQLSSKPIQCWRSKLKKKNPDLNQPEWACKICKSVH
jgi:hypothetical protein